MSYVDEKIAKVTLDNKAFTKNAEDTIKSLERLETLKDLCKGDSDNDNNRDRKDVISDEGRTVSDIAPEEEGIGRPINGLYS